MILNAIEGKPLPVYGDGGNIRDWLYVEDHVRALVLVLTEGRPGSRYNIGGRCERTNLQVVHAICDLLDDIAPAGAPRRQLISFVSRSAWTRSALCDRSDQGRERTGLATKRDLRERTPENGPLVYEQQGMVAAIA